MSERDMLDLLERLLAVVTPAKAAKVLFDLGIHRRSLFAELDFASPSRLHAFLSKRLPRVLNESPISTITASLPISTPVTMWFCRVLFTGFLDSLQLCLARLYSGSACRTRSIPAG